MKKFALFLLTFILLLVTPFSQSLATGSDELKWTKATFGGSITQWLSKVVYGNGIYVAIGQEGAIVTSKDGDSWKQIDLGYNYDLESIAFNNKIFVAGGHNGIILTSKDGQNWIQRDSKQTDIIGGVAWNGKFFLAMELGGVKSTDGITWDYVVKGNANILPDSTHALFWDGKEFIYSGKSMGDYARVFFSKDGENWQEKAVPKPNGVITGAAYNGKTYVIVGDSSYMATSQDGKTWKKGKLDHIKYLGGDTLHKYCTDLKSVIWTGDRFIAVGGHTDIYPQADAIIITSKDGLKWTEMPNNQKEYLTDVCAGDYGIVAVGGMEPNIIKYSSEKEWEEVLEYKEYKINGVAYDGKQYIAVGDAGKLLRSEDCKNWEDVSIGSYSLNSIVWNGEIFLAVGEIGICRTSKDGINWDSNFIGNSHPTLGSVIWNGKQFIAITKGYYPGDTETIYTSEDGIEWTTSPSGTAVGLKSAAASPSTTVVVGSGGTILSSQDGQKWIKRKAPTTADLLSVTYDSKYFVAVGKETVLYSTDGTTWQDKKQAVQLEIKKIIWNGKKYVGVYYSFDKNQYNIAFSKNGTDWEEQKINIKPDSIDHIIWDGSKYIMAATKANDSYIATSSNGLKWVVRKNISDAANGINEIVHTGKLYIATLSFGKLLTSADGITWTSRKTGTDAHLYSAAWDGKKYLVVGGKYKKQVALTSKDGVTWSVKDLETDDIYLLPEQIIWNGKQFLLTRSGGSVSVSKDGVKWTHEDIGNDFFTKVLWNGKFYVAVTGAITFRGKVLTSNDGLNWTDRNALYAYETPNATITDIVWNGKNYIAVAGNHTFTSTDGIKWDKNIINNTFTSLASDGNIFIASNGLLCTSKDSTDWKHVAEDTRMNIRYVTYVGGKFIAITNNGLLVGEYK